MEAKEKATQMVHIHFKNMFGGQEITYSGGDFSISKGAAIITVDELIESTFSKRTWRKWGITPADYLTTEYWKQVRKHITELQPPLH